MVVAVGIGGVPVAVALAEAAAFGRRVNKSLHAPRLHGAQAFHGGRVHGNPGGVPSTKLGPYHSC